MSYADHYSAEQLAKMLDRAQKKIGTLEEALEALTEKLDVYRGLRDRIRVDPETFEERELRPSEKAMRRAARRLRSFLNGWTGGRPMRIYRMPDQAPGEPAQVEEVSRLEQRVIDLGEQLHTAYLDLTLAEMKAYPDATVSQEEMDRMLFERGMIHEPAAAVLVSPEEWNRLQAELKQLRRLVQAEQDFAEMRAGQYTEG